MKSVLILGGSGYIGSEACRQFSCSGYKVINIDKKDQVHKYAEFYQYDLTASPIDPLIRLNQVLSGTELVGTVCFAAYKNLPESFIISFDYYYNNLFVLLNGLKLSRYLGSKKFVFSSSASVYSNKLVGPADEESETSGESPYGYTKLVGERLVLDTCKQFNIIGINLRYFNLIGKTEVSEDNSDSLFGSIKKCLDGGSTAKIFGCHYPTRDGTCIRDYIDIRDLVDAHKFALNEITNSGTYNVGNGKGVSVLEVMRIVQKIYPKFNYEFTDPRFGDIITSYADTTKINKLGWHSKYSLEDSIKTLL